nr:PGPGW domain-containing protein [Glaciecola sp. XM2]
MKKSLISLIGGFLVLLGLIFVIIPGPSLLLIIPGLYILSHEYPVAKTYLKKCMRMMRTSAQWLDSKLRNRRYR